MQHIEDELSVARVLASRILAGEAVEVLDHNGHPFTIRRNENEMSLRCYDIVQFGKVVRHGLFLSREEIETWCIDLVEVHFVPLPDEVLADLPEDARKEVCNLRGEIRHLEYECVLSHAMVHPRARRASIPCPFCVQIEARQRAIQGILTGHVA